MPDSLDQSLRNAPAAMHLSTPAVSFGIACCLLALALVLAVAIGSRL